jgi:heme/copper-type cytochrome/quinol oxidase subunit 3
VKLDLYLGNLLVITMLLASLAVQWAVSAVLRRDQRQASAAFAITAGFGLAFLNLLSYSASRADYGAGSSAYAVIAATLALSVGIVVAVAIGFVILTLLRVRGSQVTADNPDQARAAAWFWHYATLASIVVWYAVVVRK